MYKKILKAVIALFCIIAIFKFFSYLFYQQDDYEIIRRLSSLRLSLTLFSLNEKYTPEDPTLVWKRGYLQEVPNLKLRWRFKSNKIEIRNEFKILNTGHWAYVNNKNDKNFGLFYIDCDCKDSKGRILSKL
jgi:hypothetical protein